MGLNDSIKQAIKTKLPAVSIDDNLLTAITTMTEADVSALVVTNGEELTGIITEMDLLDGVANNSDLKEAKVSSVMTACDLITRKGSRSPCVQLDEEEGVDSALEIMLEAGVHHLLVSGDQDKVIGVISAKDVLKQIIC